MNALAPHWLVRWSRKCVSPSRMPECKISEPNITLSNGYVERRQRDFILYLDK